jgi:surface antigen
MGKKIALIGLSVLLLAGCADAEQKPGETVGKIIGSIVGGVAGAYLGKGKGRLITTAIGAVAGAWIGGELGRRLSETDKTLMQDNTQDGLENNETGTTSAWSNPDSENSGTFTPTKTYQQANGEDCREFEQTIYVDGRDETASGRACRTADGTWEITG